MPRMITISFPVADLDASKAFYTAIGFTNEANFTNDTAAMMLWSDTINIMLLTHERWGTFTTRPICPSNASEMSLNLYCESREDVDAMLSAVNANGGNADVNPPQEHGFMYGRDFTDPDGHVVGAVWMDMSAAAASDASAHD